MDAEDVSADSGSTTPKVWGVGTTAPASDATTGQLLRALLVAALITATALAVMIFIFLT